MKKVLELSVLLVFALLHTSDMAAGKFESSRRVESAVIENSETISDEDEKRSSVKTKDGFVFGESEAKIAAEMNLKLRDDLNWEFGGKPQHGWRLYAPLVCQLVGAEGKSADAASRTFAEKIARWQFGVGLPKTGIIDQETWYRMIATWQERRLKEKFAATPDKLTLAAASEWYDPTREADLRKVEAKTYAAYRKMLAAALADKSLQLLTVRDREGKRELAFDEKRLKLISAFRSQEYQNQLRARAGGNPSSAGLAKVSAHLTGHALDIYIAGEPVDTNYANRALQVNSPVYLWLVKHARKFGFVPYFYEPWHWEYIGDGKEH